MRIREYYRGERDDSEHQQQVRGKPGKTHGVTRDNATNKPTGFQELEVLDEEELLQELKDKYEPHAMEVAEPIPTLWQDISGQIAEGMSPYLERMIWSPLASMVDAAEGVDGVDRAKAEGAEDVARENEENAERVMGYVMGKVALFFKVKLGRKKAYVEIGSQEPAPDGDAARTFVQPTCGEEGIEPASGKRHGIRLRQHGREDAGSGIARPVSASTSPSNWLDDIDAEYEAACSEHAAESK